MSLIDISYLQAIYTSKPPPYSLLASIIYLYPLTQTLMYSCKTLNMKYFALIVLLLMATNLFISIDGRALRLESINDAINHPRTSEATSISTDHDHGEDSSFVVVTEGDLRPTTPGHSPGAGHSIGPTAFDAQP